MKIGNRLYGKQLIKLPMRRRNRMKRLYRSNSDRMVAGVLGGIANYFNIDPTIVRLLLVILLIPSFFTLSILYIVAAAIIPNGEIQ